MIPLHVHSVYSLLQSNVTIEKLIEKCKQFNLPNVALTDTNGMHGLIKFAKLAKDAEIEPVLGTMITVDKNDYVILLAKNFEGYSEICKIITSKKLNDDFCITKILEKDSGNLIVITCSITLLNNLKHIHDLYCELITSDKNKNSNRDLYQYCREQNIKMVATNPVYFLEKSDFELHKVLRAIDENENLENVSAEQGVVDEEFYFKSPVEITSYWKNLPEVISNSCLIAKACKFDLELDQYKYPSYDVPKDETSHSYLLRQSYEGLMKRYPVIDSVIEARMEKELSIISDLNFTDYFLIVWDIVKEANRRGMMTIGRGSAANSLIAYCLGITQVDPIKHNLYFERFLNRGRSSPPDFDIDFSWKERDEIIRYVFEKYGYENAAMISTTVTFRARSAFREVAKVFGFTEREISRYSKKIPWTSAENLGRLNELFPESKSLDFNIEPWKSIVNFASRIAGFPRHLSIHPGGIIITPKPIVNYTALEYAKNKGLGLIITQPDMYSIEDLGLIKIDLLSQRSLGVLRDTMDRINIEKSES